MMQKPTGMNAGRSAFEFDQHGRGRHSVNGTSNLPALQDWGPAVSSLHYTGMFFNIHVGGRCKVMASRRDKVTPIPKAESFTTIETNITLNKDRGWLSLKQLHCKEQFKVDVHKVMFTLRCQTNSLW